MTCHNPGDISPLWVTHKSQSWLPLYPLNLTLSLPSGQFSGDQPSPELSHRVGEGLGAGALEPYWRPLAMLQRTHNFGEPWQPNAIGQRVCGDPSCLCPAHPTTCGCHQAAPMGAEAGQLPKTTGRPLWGPEGAASPALVWLHTGCVPHRAGRHSLGGSRAGWEKFPPAPWEPLWAELLPCGQSKVLRGDPGCLRDTLSMALPESLLAAW